MYMIKVVYVGYISQLLGLKEELVQIAEGSTTGELLKLLAGKHGETFASAVFTEDDQAVDSWTRVLIDDHDIRNIEGLNTKLKDGAEVCIMALYEVPAGG